MKKATILGIALISGSLTFAQKYLDEISFWKVQPKYDEIYATIDDPEEELVMVDYEIQIEQVYEDDRLNQYRLVHKQVYVNSLDAIDAYNKIFLPVRDKQDLIRFNARVISPDGSVKRLGKADVQNSTNEDEEEVTYFALEGVEMASIIEYYYFLQTAVQTNMVYSFRDDYPCERFFFEHISPENLVYESSVFAGAPMPVRDTLPDGAFSLSSEQFDLEALHNETSSNRERHNPTLILQLNENLSTGAKNIFSYSQISQNVYANFNRDLKGRVEKKLSKFLKTIDYESEPTQQDRIWLIENAFKSEHTILGINDDRLEDIEFIFDNGVANDEGTALVLYRLYKLAGIPVELLITSDRFLLPFQKDIESATFLRDFLLYLPEVDGYLDPGNNFSRFPLVSDSHIFNYGLFIMEVSAGDITTGVDRIEMIKVPEDTVSNHKMVVSAAIRSDRATVDVNSYQEFTGYSAMGLQGSLKFMDEEEQEEFRTDLLSNFYQDAKEPNVIFRNGGPENFMKKPFIMEASFNAPDLLQLAGNKIILNAGELIGPQAEMYQEEKRQLPIETEHCRMYERTLEIEIPEGYEPSNLDDLNIHVVPEGISGEQFGFISEYRLKGNTIIVDIYEYYKTIDCPLDRYDEYVAVINAAADFNKVALVFEPK
ncbi:MAG: hypothetical protein J4F31_01925 [Flavobacteriales bacterium]|nr:hypothetical protein [Flavobacteriales bacterium]